MKRQIAALAACWVSFACMANDVRYFNEGEVPTAAEIASLLAPPAAAAALPSSHGGRTRLVQLTDSQVSPHRIDAPQQAGPLNVGVAAQSELQMAVRVAKRPSVGSVAMALRFDVDSNRVHPQHLAQLDALAAAIKQLPNNATITIVGHTDAYGPATYNIELSLKRALAVRAYMAQYHGIPSRRLVAVGKGKGEPLNRANPYAPENRRVQVHAEYEMA